ncbi:MAG: NAD(P)H-dependent glycerol-3-phosphate dehydrogenase [Acidimicrobiia bacterium]|nr:NAD(P)H-dependent glycerol-3-phosphate dehydrogenase [Acidimicrobiia bacterium]
MRYAVIGAGSWGTAVAAMLAPRHDTVIWARRPEVADEIASSHRNGSYLGDAELPPGLAATNELPEAVGGADVIVMAVPSHGFRAVLTEARGQIPATVPIVSLSKGIEQETLMRMTEVAEDVLADHDHSVIGVLTGPNLAKEIVGGQPAATVIAMEDLSVAAELQSAFMGPRFRVYTHADVVGSETAGATKNVMAIAAGMADGMGFGDNTLATLVTRALVEMTRLGVALGGDVRTFSGLAGLGDLVATCNSTQSRNHKVGVGLGEGRSLDEIIGEMNMVAEGVKSTSGVLKLADRAGVEMPIATQVGRVLYEGVPPLDAINTLMTREAKSEYGS